MFCCNCGKEIKEDMKFCKYCGALQKNISIKTNEKIVKNEVESNVAHTKKKLSGKGKYMILVFLVLAVVGGIVTIKNYHECNWCGEKYVGASYYDAWDNDITMCEDCAKQYYQGLNYTQFKIQ